MIKIDREFIRDVGSNPKATKLVRGMVGLARALGHRTVGEGVEDECTVGICARSGSTTRRASTSAGPRRSTSLCPDARRRLDDSGLLPA